MTIHLTKAQIRQVCLSKRNHLTQKFVIQASQKIIETIQTLPIYQTAEYIAWYHPTHGEVDLSQLWQNALAQKKYCYFPSIQTDENLIFLSYTKDTKLVLNRYRIPEPSMADNPAIPVNDLDLIFLPMVAFDAHRRRLGMGKGYYDKTLIHHSAPLLVGVAYEWQKQLTLPDDPWDVPVTMIITEERIYA